MSGTPDARSRAATAIQRAWRAYDPPVNAVTMEVVPAGRRVRWGRQTMDADSLARMFALRDRDTHLPPDYALRHPLTREGVTRAVWRDVRDRTGDAQLRHGMNALGARANALPATENFHARLVRAAREAAENSANYDSNDSAVSAGSDANGPRMWMYMQLPVHVRFDERLPVSERLTGDARAYLRTRRAYIERLIVQLPYDYGIGFGGLARFAMAIDRDVARTIAFRHAAVDLESTPPRFYFSAYVQTRPTRDTPEVVGYIILEDDGLGVGLDTCYLFVKATGRVVFARDSLAEHATDDTWRMDVHGRIPLSARNRWRQLDAFHIRVMFDDVLHHLRHRGSPGASPRRSPGASPRRSPRRSPGASPRARSPRR